MAAAQLKDYLENGNVVNSVNFPRLVKEREYAERFTLVGNAAKDVDKALENILDGTAHSVSYAEKGSVCYAIIDVDADICAGENSILDKLSDMDDVISVRLLKA